VARRAATAVLTGWLATLAVAGCGARPRPLPPMPVSFDPAAVAWEILAADVPELARPRGPDETRLSRGMRAFYEVVDRRRPRHPTRERGRSCRAAWVKLAAAGRAAPEHGGPLKIAAAYLASECGFGDKAIAGLRGLIKGREAADLLFYEAHFFWAETLLERERYREAIERYRYVLGELDTPLYPLALYRTAHCHWEAGEVDRAREFLGHVVDWAGDRTEPPWVPTMRARAAREHDDFAD